MPKEVNNRGLACPQPVINTKKALEELGRGTLVSIVDNEVAKENVMRFGENAGCQVSVEQRGGDYLITLVKGEAAAEAVDRVVINEGTAGVVYMITSNNFGHGAEDLGLTLMKSFMNTLVEKEPPRMLMFVNTGVFLTVAGSPVLEQIEKLAARGTEVISCGTCLEYYKLKAKLAVGRVTNMLEIADNLTGPHKVITIT